MKKILLSLAFFAMSSVVVPGRAAPAVMSNYTIQAMLSGGVPLPTIIRAIKTAKQVDLYMNEREYARFKAAGASSSEADQLMQAIHSREYDGIDTSPAEPIVRVPVESVPVLKPAATVPPVAPVAVAARPLPVAAVASASVPVAAIVSIATVPVSVAPAVPAVRVPEPWAPPIPLDRVSGSAASAPPVRTLYVNPDRLTDAEVSDAIMKAHMNGRHRIGLVLNDLQTSLLTPLLCKTCAESGYTIFVYTPEQWIQQMAVNAGREMLPFSSADVTEEMRLKKLHVVAMPSTPEYLNGNGFAYSSSVHRIVLTDTTRNTIIQPVELSNGSVTTDSALRSKDYSNASASFMMSDVAAIRASDIKGEFFITVTGSNQNKFFRVKERFFKTLFN